MGNSLRGVEEEIGVVSSEIDDEDMIFPCLDITLKVLCFLKRPLFISSECTCSMVDSPKKHPSTASCGRHFVLAVFPSEVPLRFDSLSCTILFGMVSQVVVWWDPPCRFPMDWGPWPINSLLARKHPINLENIKLIFSSKNRKHFFPKFYHGTIISWR